MFGSHCNAIVPSHFTQHDKNTAFVSVGILYDRMGRLSDGHRFDFLELSELKSYIEKEKGFGKLFK